MGRCWGQTDFALAALDAVGGPADRAARMDGVVVIVRVPVVVELLGVHRGEQVGDGDVLRAAVRAVAAGGARDEVLAAEDLLHLCDWRPAPLRSAA